MTDDYGPVPRPKRTGHVRGPKRADVQALLETLTTGDAIYVPFTPEYPRRRLVSIYRSAALRRGLVLRWSTDHRGGTFWFEPKPE